MTPNVWKMFTNSPSTLTFCPYLSWLNNLFMARFQLNRMSTYVKNKQQMCSVTQLQCRRRQMCGKCSHSLTSLRVTHFCSVVTKKCSLHPVTHFLSDLNNLFMARFQLIRMSSYAKNKLQMCSVTQHQCRRRQMCGKNHVHKFTQYTHFLWKMFTKLIHFLAVACVDWTIYSWQGFNSLGCPLMPRTLCRCFQSLNSSVDNAKCV